MRVIILMTPINAYYIWMPRERLVLALVYKAITFIMLLECNNGNRLAAAAVHVGRQAFRALLAP